MPRTSRQILGDYGETVVVRLSCPRCKHAGTLRKLPVNFRCADIICDFCGYLAQVKTTERAHAIYYPPADLQHPEMFQQREPLRESARRAGWVVYRLRLDLPQGHKPIRLG